MTLLFIAVNIAMAFVAVLVPDLVDRFGFHSVSPTLLSAFASIFIHQNLFHLLANMLFLAAVGPAVEFATGASRYFGLFWIGGIVGVLLHWVITMRNPGAAPLIGASGSVSACAAYYSIRYAHIRVPVLPNISIPILGVVGIWVALQALGVFVRIGDPTGGTAFWAHLGGFASGAALALAFRAPKEGEIQFGHEVLDRMNYRGPAAVVAAAQNHLLSHPNDVRALRELAESYRQLGDVSDEVTVLIQMLESSSGESVRFAADRLCQLNKLSELSAVRRMRLAHDFEVREPELSLRILKSVINEPDSEPQKPDAILALLELEAEGKSELASELVEKYPLHPATELARARGLIS